MPTILRRDGYRFFFYSHEGKEPPHIHVIGRGGEAKIWLIPIEISKVYALSPCDLRLILEIVQNNVKLFLEKYEEWHELDS
jgi:hypothetical protein